jgi:hypothetical protein
MRATTNYPLFHRQKDMLSYWLMQSRDSRIWMGKYWIIVLPVTLMFFHLLL